MNYDVHLDSFEGPLDLLLHLVQKRDLEIKEIQVSEITSEYLAYLETMQNLNLDIAGDFLVMASMLMQIKVKMLHPENEEDAADVETEINKIKAKLQEYQKYKEAAKFLANKEQKYAHTYYRPHPVIDTQDFQLDATIYDLIASFQEALKTLPEEVREIMYKEIPIETKMREIIDLLSERQHISFTEIMKLQPSRQALIVSFIAVLELIKSRQIIAKQSELFEEIRIYKISTVEPIEINEDELALKPENKTVENTEPFQENFELVADNEQEDNNGDK